jgi:hypothetical protein
MKRTSDREVGRSHPRLSTAGALALCLLVASSLTDCSKDTPAPAPPPLAAPQPPPPPPPPAPAPAPAVVTNVTLGKTLGPDKKVLAPLEILGPKDTIYASIDTTGVGKATAVKAKWTFTDKKGRVVPVNEEVQTLDLDGPATHEFHIAKKTPWPKGTYNLEVFLNNSSVAKKGFSVN